MLLGAIADTFFVFVLDDWIAVVYSSDATTTAIAACQRRDLLFGSAAHRLVPVHGLAGMLYSRFQTPCELIELHCY